MCCRTTMAEQVPCLGFYAEILPQMEISTLFDKLHYIELNTVLTFDPMNAMSAIIAAKKL